MMTPILIHCDGCGFDYPETLMMELIIEERVSLWCLECAYEEVRDMAVEELQEKITDEVQRRAVVKWRADYPQLKTTPSFWERHGKADR